MSLSFISEANNERVRAAYGPEKYERLVALGHPESDRRKRTQTCGRPVENELCAPSRVAVIWRVAHRTPSLASSNPVNGSGNAQ